MKKTLNLLALGTLVVLLGQTFGFATENTKTVAIVVANRSEPSLNSQIQVFEDLITARVTDLGFAIISRDIVLSAVADLASTSERNSLDSAVDNQTSALRLAQNIGADYVLVGTILGLDTENRTSSAYGVNIQNQIHTLRTTYRILSGVDGSSLTAGSACPSRSIQQSANSSISTPGLVRELMDRASAEIAAKLKIKEETDGIQTVDVEQALVGFSVVVTLNGVQFPEISIDATGQPKVSDNSFAVEAASVSVDIDGITVGTTGSISSKLRVSPGLHRIRLYREDLVPFERMVNITEGMKLNIAMELNERGRERWEHNTLLLQDLKKEAVLTDAEVEKVRGMAQALRQSGYKIDIKVDTDEGIEIENNQGMMQQN
ncbi:MAG: hypothetical protein ACO3ZW_03830 [Opitutales bacterium]|jgi:hypothetical protein